MDYLNELRNSEYVREKDLDGDIHSFNFTRDAFFDKHWNSITEKARGLFCDVTTGKVVCRSFNKFFNLGEMPETQMPALRNNLKYPVVVYEKYNGFLAMCAYNPNREYNLFLASKSTDKGYFAEWFREIFYDTFTLSQREGLARTLKNLNATLVFECIDVDHNPHIIGYDKSHLVAIGLIKNDFDYKPMSYNMLKIVGGLYGVEVKKKVAVLKNWEEFQGFCEHAVDVHGIEGYVLEDADNFQVKIKTDEYKYWKQVRSLIQLLAKGKPISSLKQKYHNGIDSEFFDWLVNFVYNCKIMDVDTYKNIPLVRYYWEHRK